MDVESECPVCNKKIKTQDIENHVNRCLFLNQTNGSASQVSSPKAMNGTESKRTFSIFQGTSSASKSSAKRTKLSSGAPGKGLNSNQIVNLNNNDESEPQDDDTQTQKPNQPEKFDPFNSAPLAEKVRPSSIDDYFGQSHVLGKDTVLRKLLDSNEIPSMILWGPPGCGKTTLSNIIQHKCKQNSSSYRFVKTSAAGGSGVNDIKEIVKVARNETKFKRKTILFMDEIHRFNKAQQDVFLPSVENGTITLIGATTENPSFSLNSALLSRCRVIVLEKLSTDDMIGILKRALIECRGICVDSNEELPDIDALSFMPKFITETASLKWLAEMSDGDARIALNSLQLAIQAVIGSEDFIGVKKLNVDELKEGIKKSHILYDRKGDQHYDMISALHKSIRASDDNAALYWCTRMIVGGEDPRYICRRLVRAASEDIGLADSNAIQVALSALQAVQLVGMPEADCIIAQAAVYLARAPKSTETYMALNRCKAAINECKGPLPAVPLHLRNAPTRLMKDLGYAKGYNKQHKDVSGLDYLPEGMEDVNFFD